MPKAPRIRDAETKLFGFEEAAELTHRVTC